MTLYYGHLTRDEYIAAIDKGLSILPKDAYVHKCTVCGGAGEYRQNYNLGCGMGMSRMMGNCDHCGGTGLVMDDNMGTNGTWKQVPHVSTLFQVLFAGGLDRELLMRLLPGRRSKRW